jgi:predicted TIM-barrel fold metal-dependent hydrolase
MGFRGIKLHPRFSGLTRRLGLLGPTLRAAGEAGLVVFLCTYLHGRLADYPGTDPLFDLVESLRQAPTTRVVLVHGGDVRLLQYAELVRHNPNLLLDLSLTLMKYAGSSLDADLRFLFRHLDQRICIGTDWPEYSAQAVRARFEDLTGDVTLQKRRNAAFCNLAGFLGMDQP